MAALLAASENRNMDVIELLANRGADPGVDNAEGKSAFGNAEARLGEAEDRLAEFDNQFLSLTVVNQIRSTRPFRGNIQTELCEKTTVIIHGATP